MSDTEPDRASGGIPHTFRLIMAWRWMKAMPPELKRRKAFLYAVQTVATLADVQGRTRFQDTGQAIRMPQLATAMGSREKDARRFLAAAIAAGILTTEEPPRRGRTTVYRLVIPLGQPRWAAALAVLEVGETDARDEMEHTGAAVEFGRPAPEPAPAAREQSSGVRSPNHSGAVPPISAEPVRATDARPSSGYGRPLSSGAVPPNNPGSTQEDPQELVAVGPQPEDARGHETHERADDPSRPPGPPPLRSVPPPPDAARGHGRTPRPRMPDGQAPLLMPVPGPARPEERPAHAPEGDQPIGAPRDGWRAAVARERPEDAARVYGDRWTGEHARHLPDPTGT